MKAKKVERLQDMMVLSMGRGLRYMCKQGFHASNCRAWNDSKKIVELVGGLEAWSAICGRSIRHGNHRERLRIYGYRA